MGTMWQYGMKGGWVPVYLIVGVGGVDGHKEVVMMGKDAYMI